MTPRVFSPTTRNFSGFGLGALPDVTGGTVKEYRNDRYDLDFSYPSEGRNAELIQPGNIVVCSANDSDGMQPFRIVNIRKTSPGVLDVHGKHLALWIMEGLVQPPLQVSGSATQILVALQANKIGGLGVTLSTDIDSSGSFKSSIPKTFLSSLIGSEGSFLDVFGGGTLHYNGLNVSIERNRGADRGVRAAYGSNLIRLDIEANLTSYASHIYPFFASDDATVLIPGQMIPLGAPSSQPQKVELVDFTDKFDSPPTPDALYHRAQRYASENLVQTPQETITAEFVPLWDTTEYKGRIARQQISIDDLVTIIHPGLGINQKSKVVGLEWDILAERYTSVKTGAIRRTIIDTIQSLQKGARK